MRWSSVVSWCEWKLLNYEVKRSKRYTTGKRVRKKKKGRVWAGQADRCVLFVKRGCGLVCSCPLYSRLEFFDIRQTQHHRRMTICYDYKNARFCSNPPYTLSFLPLPPSVLFLSTPLFTSGEDRFPAFSSFSLVHLQRCPSRLQEEKKMTFHF